MNVRGICSHSWHSYSLPGAVQTSARSASERPWVVANAQEEITRRSPSGNAEVGERTATRLGPQFPHCSQDACDPFSRNDTSTLCVNVFEILPRTVNVYTSTRRYAEGGIYSDAHSGGQNFEVSVVLLREVRSRVRGVGCVSHRRRGAEAQRAAARHERHLCRMQAWHVFRGYLEQGSVGFEVCHSE